MGIAAPQYKVALDEAAEALGASYGATGISSRMSRQAQDTNRAKFRALCRAILNLPPVVLKDTAKLLGYVTEAFETAKKSTPKGAVEAWNATAKAIHPRKMPISLENARKNSSEGIRALRPALGHFTELINVDLPVAVDSLRVRTGDEKRLNQTEIAAIWRTPLDTRASMQDMPVNLGTDSLGCIHHLKPDFRRGHEVKERTLKDGTVEEYCMVSPGSSNQQEEIEVVISQAPSGPLFKAAVAEQLKEYLTGRKRRAFIKACREAAELPEFTIRDLDTIER